MTDWAYPSRVEAITRHVRNIAVAGAMATHADLLNGEITPRMVDQIAHLAVETALLQYAAHIGVEIARLNSSDRLKAEELLLRQPPLIHRDYSGARPVEDGA